MYVGYNVINGRASTMLCKGRQSWLKIIAIGDKGLICSRLDDHGEIIIDDVLHMFERGLLKLSRQEPFYLNG